VPSNPVPVAVSSILVETFAVEKFQFLLFQHLYLLGVVRRDFIAVAEHGRFQFIGFDLKLNVLHGLLVTLHLDLCIRQIRRRFQFLVETARDIRVLPLPSHC